MPASAQAAVTVAVVSWNTRDLLARCLDSLQDDVERGLARVVVVDNESEDGSADLVRREYRWVDLIEPGENLGFGPAVNRVGELSDGPWLAAANADIELTPGALSTMVAPIEGNPRIGAVAPRLISPTGETQPSAHRFPSPVQAALFASGAYRVLPRLRSRMCLPGHWDVGTPRRIDWAHGAFLLFRREAFDRAGGFDEGQWLYAEDMEIAWRLREAGYEVWYEPAEVRHAVSASAVQAFGAFGRHRREYEASYSWLSRRRGRAFSRLTAVISVAGVLPRLALFSVLARISPERWEKDRARSRNFLALHRIGLRRAPG